MAGTTQTTPQDAPPSTAAPGFGKPTSRVDGRVKVTGAARYASDFPGQAHAFLVTSTIARGRISAIDDGSARATPGVLDILTYRNVGNRIKPGKRFEHGGYMGSSLAPLTSDEVQFNGQIVAVVVADTFEAAREGAHRLQITYAAETPSATFDSPGTTTQTKEAASREGDQAGGKQEERPEIGDAAAALDQAPFKVDVHYETPTQHHKPHRAVHHGGSVGRAEADGSGSRPRTWSASSMA